MSRLPVVQPVTAPPPLVFALVWNGFISVHAFFMLGVVWNKKPAMLAPLLLFYSLFFGVGFFMARITWRWHRFRGRFGTPTISNAPPAVSPGSPVTLTLRFDRTWSSAQDIQATAHWAAYSLKTANGSAAPADALPVSGLVAAGAKGTDWTATLVPPPLPFGLSPEAAMLEIRLISPPGSTTGWRLQLPAAANTAGIAVTPGVIDLAKMNPGERTRALKVMGNIATGLMFGAAFVLFLMARDGRLSFMDLLFPLFMVLGGWYLRKLTDFLRRRDKLSDVDPQAVQAMFRQNFGRSFGLIPALMIGAFLADAFLPRDVIGTLRQLSGMAGPTIRDEAPSSTLDLTPKGERGSAASLSSSVAPANPAAQQMATDPTLWDLLSTGKIAEAREQVHGHPERLEEETRRVGESPAHMVAYTGNIAALTMLLDEGLDVNAVNRSPNGRGETLLMSAARSPRNSVDMIRLLLWRGARLHEQDTYGKNATDWAEFFGVADASDELCRKGLEPTALDRGSPNNEVRKRANCQKPSAARR